MTDPLFRSVDHALAFAFRHPQGDLKRPAMNTFADGPKRAGRGLAGLDGAGQAGMILAALRSLGQLSFALGAARHLPKAIPCQCGRSCCTGWQENPTWRDAINEITAYASDAIPHRRVMLAVRKAVVMRHFGEKVSFAVIAKRCHVDRDTASAHAKVVIDFIREKDRLMRSDLYERLSGNDMLIAA